MKEMNELLAMWNEKWKEKIMPLYLKFSSVCAEVEFMLKLLKQLCNMLLELLLLKR